MAFVGMNLDTVKGELPKWQTLGEDLQTVITNVDTQVQEANDAWNGPDSDKFVAEWQGQYRAQLVAAKTLVENLTTTLGQEITEQARVSGA
ncbi:hypothetical protein [Janibacter limosus]|jgi:uncharacterized protein YukE|uniref:WXG100 family type VII secretion target n=1 Tax=Janibacter limosus TaxID=53458 RepID=A0A4P6MWX4_9MICO|nr:hypothetical protein [Janibacter limosus]QBF47552.1 hypothetical protein EXU32_15620 [Janibacter limosus]